MAVKLTSGDVSEEMLKRLEELEEDESIDLTTTVGRDRYARRMAEIQSALELMEQVLLKQGLEAGFIEETSKVLALIEQMEPSPNMGMVPCWFVDVRTGNPAIFVFPTTPADALGEGNKEDVYTPNGLWYSTTTVYNISAILARVFPLPNYMKRDIVPTPVWQVYDCAYIARLNAQALHLYRFDESAPFGKQFGLKTAAQLPEPAPAKKGKKGKGKKDDTGPSKRKSLKAVLAEKYTPEKYFEDIKLTVDAFKCNEVFFLLQTLQVRYVSVFTALVRRIYGEQLLREMTIAAALDEYLNMRKGFGESVTDRFAKLGEKFWMVAVAAATLLVIAFFWMLFNIPAGVGP